jgi:kumamolisin
MHAGDRWLEAAADSESIDVTVLLRPSGELAEELLSGRYHAESRQKAEQNVAANPQELSAVRAFAGQHGLHVKSEDAGSGRVVLTGTVQQLQEAFGVEIGEVQDQSGRQFRSYRGEIHLPANLKSVVTAVLGLDQRPVARHAGKT